MFAGSELEGADVGKILANGQLDHADKNVWTKAPAKKAQGKTDMSPEKRMQPVVLAKGFGQGTGTEEFRIVLPANLRGDICSRLSAIRNWSGLLAPLYDRTGEDLSRQYAILLAADEFAVFCVAPTRDSFERRSLVIVGFVADRDLNHDARVAAEALDRIREGIWDVAEAIQTGDRERLQRVATHIASGPPPESRSSELEFFRDLLSSRGHAGAATPLLLGLGADVVIGTSHEAMAAVGMGLTVNAYFDIRSGRLVSLSPPEPEATEPRKSSPASRRTMKTKELLEEIIERLDAMEEDLRDLKKSQARLLKEVRRKKSWF